MPYTETYIAQLLLKKLSGELTPSEVAQLEEWRSFSSANESLYEKLTKRDGLQPRLKDFEEAALHAAQVPAPLVGEEANAAKQTRVRTLPKRWWRYTAVAAVFLLMFSAALYYYWQPAKQPVTVSDLSTVQPEIQGAGFKAKLTLADGSTILLDSNSKGTIARQGNASVVKMPDGEIRYEGKGDNQDLVMMNTMSTPKGGQYRLVLPDGTKVWLNAASSITYPATFQGNQRNIKMTGEIYLEVAHDKTKPFIVDINGEGAVEVLGTEFNINAYKDYGAIKTTLIQGKVKAMAGSLAKQTATAFVMLAPGQQAIQEAVGIDGSKPPSIRVNEDVDLAQVTAWKNGIFDVNGASFQTLMHEVERWYDVEVRYQNAIPNIRFRGKMDRAVKLSGVIRFLKDYGVEATLENRTLIIKEK